MTVLRNFLLSLFALSLFCTTAFAADAPLPATSVGDCQPPTAPTSVQATAVSDAQINIAWGASSDNVSISGYDIYRDGVKVGTVAGTSFQDSSLTAQTQYAYRVVAFDPTGNRSASNDPAAVATTLATGGGGGPVAYCPPIKTALPAGSNLVYNTPLCNGLLPLSLEFTLRGGGGGGYSGGPGNQAQGTAGTASCVKASGVACTSPLYRAGGGAPGNIYGGYGGDYGGCDGDSSYGEPGTAGGASVSGQLNGSGGTGGGAGGGPGGWATTGQQAIGNDGGGGGGGYATANGTLVSGAGGGQGGLCRAQISAPLNSYVYTTGAGGAGAAAGANGTAGGNGAPGRIVAIARWQ